MRSFIIFIFVICHYAAFSQKVTLTPITFNKEFTLEKAPTNSVLKDYTQFSQSPFKKIPDGFTLSYTTGFYKFDTLNSSLKFKKRSDVEGIYYYRNCEDGRWCYNNISFSTDKKAKWFYSDENRKWRSDLLHFRMNCCDSIMDTDTTAIFYKNEFISFQDEILDTNSAPFSLVSENFVTNKEYREFVDYCIDSIIRTYLADRFPNKYYLNYDQKKSWDNLLNYSIKYNVTDKLVMPIVSQMYFPDHEKYNWKKVFDSRKIVYKVILGNDHYHDYTIIYPDTLTWLYKNSKKEELNYSIWASENYFNKKDFHDLPVQGVNYWQAKAFLDWKTKFHNRELKRQKSNYRVEYTLPLPEECNSINNPKIITPKIDFEKYVITNKEYEEYVTYVVDSAVTWLKYDNYSPNGNNKRMLKVEKILKKPRYDDDGEIVDWSLWYNNKKAYKNYFQMDLKAIKKDSLLYTFEELLIPEREINYWNYEGFDTRKIFFRYMSIYYNSDTLYQNRDLSLFDWGDKSHLYFHSDRSDFMLYSCINIFPGYDARYRHLHEEDLAFKKIHDFFLENERLGIRRVLPDSLDESSYNFIGNTIRFELDSLFGYKLKLYDFKKAPNEPITAITYEQAKAYYYWKNEVPYIPTKEEWQQIQKGINPYKVKELEVPGPFFRYAIRVYPLKDE